MYNLCVDVTIVLDRYNTTARIVTIVMLPRFISNWTILMFNDFIIIRFQRL